LVRAGAKSVRLVRGTIPLLLVAGVVEGFVSPTDLAPGMKFLLAGALGTLLVLYLISGRAQQEAESATVVNGAPR
jgi:uncharacterized membrane protein SpoIIM required for sporulation